jgi:hypothetical protein
MARTEEDAAMSRRLDEWHREVQATADRIDALKLELEAAMRELEALCRETVIADDEGKPAVNGASA